MNAQRYICTLCNYVYEQPKPGAKGKTEEIPFEELPADWKHESCTGTKEEFQPCACVSWAVYEQTIPVSVAR